MRSILFVCLGNICRSPLMEGIVRARWPAHWPTPRLDSAGLGDWHAGEPPDLRAIMAAGKRGIDISRQRARLLRSADFSDFELLLAADHAVLRELQRRSPAALRERCALYLDWSGARSQGAIADPYNGSERDFDRTFELIDSAVPGLLLRLHGP